MKTYILLVLLIPAFLSVASPNPPNPDFDKGVIKGVIVDSTDSGFLPFATAVLYRAQDSTLAGGASSGTNGAFIISKTFEGRYYLKISYMGYQSKYISGINITPDQKEIDAGIIKLAKQSLVLSGVRVSGEKTSEEYHVDKKVINVSGNISATGGTAVDALLNQPSIQIDANGNVSLRGNSNFSVLVDGKPSPLSGTDALRQVPANIIDNIELITNPSAKYESEGTAGIINIITRKIDFSSASGIANAGFGSRDKYNGDLNTSFRTQDYAVSVGGDARRYSTHEDITLNRTLSNTADAVGIAVPSYRRDGYTGRIAFDNYFSDKSTLGFRGSYGNIKSRSGVLTKITEPGTTGLRGTTNDATNTETEYVNGGMNYQKSFTPKTDELNFDLSFTNLKMSSNQITAMDSYGAGVPPASVLKGIDNQTSRFDSRIKMTYKYTFTKAGCLEAGLQSNIFLKKTGIGSKNFDAAANTWVTNPAFSNDFKFRNNIYAGYTTYTGSVFGLDYQAGLRLEYTDRVFEQLTTGGNFEYRQLHAFPSAGISGKIGTDQQVQLNYSRRIRRPNDGDLNPYSSYSDAYIIITGNPYLRPSFAQSVELNYQKSFTGVYLTVQNYFKKSEGTIDQIQKTDGAGHLVLTRENVTNTLSFGSEISLNITPAQWLKIDPSVNLFHLKMDPDPRFGLQSRDKFAWTGRLNATISLPTGTRIQLFTNYFPEQITSQGSMSDFMIIGASARQDFFDRQLTATLGAQNLFGRTKYRIYSSGPGFSSYVDSRPEAPVITFSLSYNFNNFKKDKNYDQVEVNDRTGF